MNQSIAETTFSDVGKKNDRGLRNLYQNHELAL